MPYFEPPATDEALHRLTRWIDVGLAMSAVTAVLSLTFAAWYALTYPVMLPMAGAAQSSQSFHRGPVTADDQPVPSASASSLLPTLSGQLAALFHGAAPVPASRRRARRHFRGGR